MKVLKTLDLYGNPMETSQTYKYRLCINPSLTRFDGLDVSAGSLLRKRLNQLSSEWETNRLIEQTHQQTQKWVNAQKEIKGAAMELLTQRQNKLNQEFESYKKKVDE